MYYVYVNVGALNKVEISLLLKKALGVWNFMKIASSGSFYKRWVKVQYEHCSLLLKIILMSNGIKQGVLSSLMFIMYVIDWPPIVFTCKKYVFSKSKVMPIFLR